MIRILLVDDHAMVRAGIRLILDRQPDMRVVGEAQRGAEAVALALHLQPTVVILDVGLPDMSGLDALERIKARAPQIRVLMISGIKNEQYLLRALRAGALGYLLKESGAADLVQAVRMVAHGQLALMWSDGEVNVETIVHEGCLRLEPPRHSVLTTRERDVLGLVARGYSNHTIAAQLGVSPKTVDTHRTHLMEKLGVHTRADLTRYALEHGYLTVA